jgi:hypothetical protein
MKILQCITIAILFSGCASEMRDPTILDYMAQSQAGFVVRDLDRKWSAERAQRDSEWQSGQNAAMAASAQGMAALRTQPAPCHAAWGATCR